MCSFYLLKGPAKIRILRLTHEAHKMFVSGKITNLIRTDANVLKYVFSLPFGICIYNLIQTGVCVCVLESLCFVANVHIYVNKTFSLCKGVQCQLHICVHM